MEVWEFPSSSSTSIINKSHIKLPTTTTSNQFTFSLKSPSQQYSTYIANPQIVFHLVLAPMLPSAPIYQLRLNLQPTSQLSMLRKKREAKFLPLRFPTRIEIYIFPARSNPTWQKSKKQLPKSGDSAFCLAEAKSNILTSTEKNGMFNPSGWIFSPRIFFNTRPIDLQFVSC
jgi:hypothetical protein